MQFQLIISLTILPTNPNIDHIIIFNDNLYFLPSIHGCSLLHTKITTNESILNQPFTEPRYSRYEFRI